MRWLALALALGLTSAGPVIAAEQSGATRTAVDRLDQRVRRLENMIDSGQLVKLMRRIDALTQQVRELRGQIETQGHQLEELRERQRRLYGDLDRRLRELEVAGQQRQQEQQQQDGGGSDQATTPPSGDAAAEQIEDEASGAELAEAEEGGSGASESVDADTREAQRESYNAAFDLLKEGRYDAAGQAFTDFLEAHPEGPYSDNAQYWLGESRYVTRNFESALEAFRQTVQRYPDSSKVPDARLKIGYTLHELERYEEAKSVLREVVNEYANDTVARLAEERLLQLERRGQSGGN
jgi:tol-pal system protein YbgF